MEYRMKDIMEPPKTLEEQKKEAREARNGMDLMYNNVIDIINSELGRK